MFLMQTFGVQSYLRLAWSGESPIALFLSNTDPFSFINNITDHRQYQKPEQFRGGILADPMGLGKSLSMISLLVSESHSPQNAGRIERQGRNQTLLVVPSTRRSTITICNPTHYCYSNK